MPAAPGLAAVTAAGQLGWDGPLPWLAAALVVLSICYGFGMLALSRRPVALAADPGLAAREKLFVFLMPCLNEELVIERSLRRLLAVPGGHVAVLVIDDGSDDGTAAAVSGVADERVWLLRRRPPEARQGKGEALNAALRYLAGSGRLAGRDPDSVIITVVDADGRLDPHAIGEVGPYFDDPGVGAVQIGIRISNRGQSVLARMQDMEFVIYTEVFQQGRRHLGSVGLGGNGQFCRLSALRSLGPGPWTRSLTEDLDLGVRLAVTGWRNEYCPTAWVHQQGVVEPRRLVRQRSRWFQGNLQAWRLIPAVLRSRYRGRTDLLYVLTTPAIVLIASLLTASFAVGMVYCAVLAATGHHPFGWWLAVTYLLSVGPALVFSVVYWRRERATGLRLRTAAGLAHVYVAYSMLCYAAGWWAVVRAIRGRTGWAKTARVAERPAAHVPAASPVLAASLVPAASPVLAMAGAGGGYGPALTTPAGPAGPGSPAAGSGPPAPRPGRGRRRRLAVAAVAAAGLAAVAVLGLTGRSPAGRPWLTVFTGQGRVTGTVPGPVTLSPARATSPAGTHAALLVSARQYRDFTAALTVRTIRQLRQGAAGRRTPGRSAGCCGITRPAGASTR